MVRNTFNSTNMLSIVNSAMRQDEGVNYMMNSIGNSMDQRSCSPSIRGTSDKIVWGLNNKKMSTLEILDFVLDLLDDHEYKYDQEHVDDDHHHHEDK